MLCDPMIFGGYLLGEGALEVMGEDAPGVGLDLEVGAEVGVILQDSKGIGGVV